MWKGRKWGEYLTWQVLKQQWLRRVKDFEFGKIHEKWSKEGNNNVLKKRLMLCENCRECREPKQ